MTRSADTMPPYSRAPPLLDLALEGVARLVAASISTTADQGLSEGHTITTRHVGDVWPLNTIHLSNIAYMAANTHTHVS